MPTIPKQYAWILNEKGPKMMLEALKEFGTIEAAGNANNQKIIKWAAEVGGTVANVYKNDAIPWCGLFMAVIALRAGKIPPKDPLWALNWGNFGHHVDQGAFGDTLVFVRKTPNGATAGHVALYVGEDATTYHCLGGNQSDQVSFTRMAKTRLYTIRRPDYVTQPAQVRRIVLAATGKLSANEQ